MAAQGLAAYGLHPHAAATLTSLKAVQSADGGFPFLAAPGQASDPDSTALSIQGILALGGSPTTARWRVSGVGPYAALAAFQLGCTDPAADRGAYFFPVTVPERPGDGPVRGGRDGQDPPAVTVVAELGRPGRAVPVRRGGSTVRARRCGHGHGARRDRRQVPRQDRRDGGGRPHRVRRRGQGPLRARDARDGCGRAAAGGVHRGRYGPVRARVRLPDQQQADPGRAALPVDTADDRVLGVLPRQRRRDRVDVQHGRGVHVQAVAGQHRGMGVRGDSQSPRRHRPRSATASNRSQSREPGSAGTSTACSTSAVSGTMSSAASFVERRTTGAAAPASYACNQRTATTHQRSPGTRPGEAVRRHRRDQVVPDRALVLEELGCHDGAHRVTAEILRPARAAPVAVEAGDRVVPARLQRAAQNAAGLVRRSGHVGHSPASRRPPSGARTLPWPPVSRTGLRLKGAASPLGWHGVGRSPRPGSAAPVLGREVDDRADVAVARHVRPWAGRRRRTLGLRWLWLQNHVEQRSRPLLRYVVTVAAAAATLGSN